MTPQKLGLLLLEGCEEMKIEYDEKGIPKIGGWLIYFYLPILGSILSSLLWAIYDANIYYKVKHLTVLSFLMKLEITFLIFMFIYSCIIFYIFIKKRHNFAKHFLLFNVAGIIFNIFIHVQLDMALKDYGISAKEIGLILNRGVGDILAQLFLLIIFLLYFKKSKRVAVTFACAPNETTINGQQQEEKDKEVANSFDANSATKAINRDVKLKKIIPSFFVDESSVDAVGKSESINTKTLEKENIALEPIKLKHIVLCPYCGQKIILPSIDRLQVTCPECKQIFENEQNGSIKNSITAIKSEKKDDISKNKTLSPVIQLLLFCISVVLVIALIYFISQANTQEDSITGLRNNNQSKIMDHKSTIPEHIRFDIADRDLLEILAHTTSDKEIAFNKFWASSISNKYYQACTVSAHRRDTPIEENIKFSDFFLSLSQDCTKIFLEMGIWVNKQLPACTNSTGYIFIMDKQIPMIFSSSNKDDGSQHIFINDIKIPPSELVALMKKGEFMEIHLDALNVAAAFSLKGFTASFGRIDRLCRSRR